jgi:hypothetical protein
MTTEVGTVRTYEPVRIKLGQAREIFRRDLLSGEFFDPNEATETIMLLGATSDLRGAKPGFRGAREHSAEAF